MNQLTADTEVCQGYANCVVAAPDHFDLDDDGKVDILVEHPDEADLGMVREAVDSCPVRALKLTVTS